MSAVRLTRMPSPILAVVGATASGKSSLALDLAERLGGEIVNTDAMAVYRGMDVGTAKTPFADRRGIAHHLLDLLDVTEPLSVADFQRRARAVVAEIRGRGSTSVLVGGSALYTRAVLDRFDFPGTDADRPGPLGGGARRGGGARPCTSACGASTPRRPSGSCPTTPAASSVPSRWWS